MCIENERFRMNSLFVAFFLAFLPMIRCECVRKHTFFISFASKCIVWFVVFFLSSVLRFNDNNDANNASDLAPGNVQNEVLGILRQERVRNEPLKAFGYGKDSVSP